MVIGHQVEIETVPQRVARAALQLDETGVNGSSFHAQTGYFRHDERGSRLVQIPPRAQPLGRTHTIDVAGKSLVQFGVGVARQETAAETSLSVRSPEVRGSWIGAGWESELI